MSPLLLGETRFEPSHRLRKRLLSRRIMQVPTVTVTAQGYSLKFDLEDLLELSKGPLIISASPSELPDDYFLASRTLIPPSSAVGESLKETNVGEQSLLLLHGSRVLAEFSPAQQAELIAWLKTL